MKRHPLFALFFLAVVALVLLPGCSLLREAIEPPKPPTVAAAELSPLRDLCTVLLAEGQQAELEEACEALWDLDGDGWILVEELLPLSTPADWVPLDVEPRDPLAWYLARRIQDPEKPASTIPTWTRAIEDVRESLNGLWADYQAELSGL